jgi:hypothetical protein
MYRVCLGVRIYLRVIYSYEELKVIVFSKCPQFTEEVGTINWKGF